MEKYVVEGEFLKEFNSDVYDSLELVIDTRDIPIKSVNFNEVFHTNVKDGARVKITIEVEEEMSMSRIDNIVNFAKKREEDKIAKEMELLRQSEECQAQIRALKLRIKEIIDVGNACLVNGIQLEGTSWGGHEGYDTHQFVTNRWSHLVGFVQNGKSAIFELGIDAGGACGEYDFRTNGIEIYDIHEKTREKISPSLYHMKKFLENFDTFESEFYKYVDNLTK